MDLTLLGKVPPETWVIGILVLLLAGFVRAVMAGNLVPRSIHEELRVDRDGWKSKSEVDSETIRTMIDQQKDMLDGLREIKDAIRYAVRSGRGAV